MKNIPKDLLGYPTWVTSYPEFSGRHRAIHECSKNKKLRRTIMNATHDFFGVATRLRGHDCAEFCLNALWGKWKKKFRQNWEPVLDLPVYNECWGFLRNVFLNSIYRATNKKPLLRGFDTLRKIPEDLLD